MICSKCGKKNKDGALYCKRCNQILDGQTSVTKSGGGFFALNAVCAVCGKNMGLNRYRIGKSASGNDVWACPFCAKLGRPIKIIGEKAYFCDDNGNALETPDYDEEIVMKCDTCGHTYCYTQADLEESKRNADMAVRSSAMAALNAFGGTQFGAHANMAAADRASDKIVDYSRCPKCNSKNVRKVTKEELEKEKEQKVQNDNSPNVSVADEIKKFKELLDLGIITQEEFDQKKKQLLGL